MNLKKRIVEGRELEWEEVDENWAQIEQAMAQKAATNHSHTIGQISGLQAALDAKLNGSARGANNGVASLGADGKVPLNQLPNIGASANDMVFQTDTLTSEDIGKLVVLKNGKVQLPEFASAVIEDAIAVITRSDSTAFAAPSDPRVILTVGNTVAPGEYVDICTIADDNLRTREVFRFTAVSGTPMNNFEFSIGANGAETAANLKAAIENSISESLAGAGNLLSSFHSVDIDGPSVILEARILLDEDDLNADDYWTVDTVSGSSDIALSKTIYSWQDVIGSARVGLYAVLGFSYEDNNADNVQADPSMVPTAWLTQNAYHSKQYLFIGDGPAIVYLPTTTSELHGGIGGALQALLSGVTLRTFSADAFELNLPSIAQSIQWLSAEDALLNTHFLEMEFQPGTRVPPICNLPVVGQVNNVVGSQVMISTQPIRSFLLKGQLGVSISQGYFPGFGLLDLARVCILSWDDPGYVQSAANLIGILGYHAIFIIRCAACGYVQSYEDADAEDVFIGAFSLDMTPITISLLLNDN